MILASTASGEAQSVAAGVRSESAKLATVNVDVVNVPLSSVLETIARQAGLRTSWDDHVVNAAPRVTLHVRDLSADVAFAKALAGTGMQAVILGKHVDIITDIARASRAQGGLAGKVVDSKTQQPLRGAVIVLDDASKGIISGDDGHFRFPNVASGTHTIHVRLLGYRKAMQTTVVVEGQIAAVTVALEPSISALDQIVVTGTIVATAQKAVPNAMTIITAKDIEQRGITHIDQLFRGDVPGLFVRNEGSNTPLDEVNMFSRGATKLQTSAADGTPATNPIKTYVDGVELADSKYLSQIDPRSIERIEILTGPQASTIYGSNAINGVMQIFTKRGTSARPQLTATMITGLVQNNFRSSLTPVHNADARLSGVEGRWSYQAGGSWDYTGPWTPAKQTARLGGYGGGRLQLGAFTADASLRLATTENRSSGVAYQTTVSRYESGQFLPFARGGNGNLTLGSLNGQTLGLTLGYAVTPWWSHELVIGSDASDQVSRSTTAAYTAPNDTLLALAQTNETRTSIRYATTSRVPLGSIAQLVVTAGADGWKSFSSTMSTSASVLTGALTGTPLLSRSPSHNTGAFVQGQLGLWDDLFLTYGLRAEWNPNYGTDVGANLAPRVGAAYSHDLGFVTMKLRASYGRSTRPPASTLRDAQTLSEHYAAINYLQYAIQQIPVFGDYFLTLGNPELGPEFQQGGEGGLELYFGSRGSLIITRYNQTVDGLIANLVVDSVRSLQPNSPYCGTLDPAGYCYATQNQNLNIGSIRNQGWELQASGNVGSWTAKGTYSWTKSRVLGITPAYRAILTGGQYQPGASFTGFPEHTWALDLIHTESRGTVALTITGAAHMYALTNDLGLVASSSIRLTNTRPRTSIPQGYLYEEPGYVMADLNASRQLFTNVEGIFQVQNLTDFYQNDYNTISYPVIGRQSKVGLRVRW